MMTLDELEAAWNAQADQHNQWCDIGLDEKIAYAQQVEREACAKVCDGFVTSLYYENAPAQNNMAKACARAIRLSDGGAAANVHANKAVGS